MLGWWPSFLSPWFGDGKTFAATGLSGDGNGLMASPELAFGRDALPRGIDGGQALRGDLDGLRRQPPGDFPIGMVFRDELAVMPLQSVVAHAAIRLEDEVGIVGQSHVAGRDALEIR